MMIKAYESAPRREALRLFAMEIAASVGIVGVLVVTAKVFGIK